MTGSVFTGASPPPFTAAFLNLIRQWIKVKLHVNNRLKVHQLIEQIDGMKAVKALTESLHNFLSTLLVCSR